MIRSLLGIVFPLNWEGPRLFVAGLLIKSKTHLQRSFVVFRWRQIFQTWHFYSAHKWNNVAVSLHSASAKCCLQNITLWLTSISHLCHEIILKLFSICIGFSPCFSPATNAQPIFHAWHIIKWQCQRMAHHFRYYSPRRHVWSSWCFTPFKFRYHRFLFNKLGKWSNVKPFWKGAPFAFAKHTDFSSISRSENCFWFNLLLFQTMPQQWVRRTRWRLGFPFEKRHHIDSITNGKWH